MTSNLKIEHYILGRTLGVGAFGKVKRNKNFCLCISFEFLSILIFFYDLKHNSSY